MKKAILFLTLFIILGTAMAQQGSWYVGGQVGFGSQKSENFNSNIVSKTTSTNFSPEVGMFLSDALSLGVAVNFSTQKNDNNVSNTDYTSQFLTSPVLYVRKFFSIEDLFLTFVGLDVNFSTGANKQRVSDVVTTTSKVSGFGVNLNVGLAFPLGEKFTAVGKYGLLGYSSTTNKDDVGVKQSSNSVFGFNVNSLGSVFNVGLYYTFMQ